MDYMQQNNKVEVIQQPFGIGDILFISPLVSKYAKENSVDLVWPIADHYYWVKDYLDLPDNVYVISQTEYKANQSFLDSIHIPLEHAQNILAQHGVVSDCMQSKYMYMGYNPNEWRTLSWKRNFKKEMTLKDYLGINNGESYNFINTNFASPELEYKLDIKVNNSLPSIYMDFYPDTTLLDWMGVIEGATEIHTVSTSTFYMIECMKDKSNKQFHLYNRFGLDKNLDPIRPIISDFWTLHE